MEFSRLLRERYSVRAFRPDPVPPELVQGLLEAARTAPTAVNRQPQRLLVLSDPGSMEKLARCTRFTFQAPMAIVVCCDESEAWVRPFDRENSGVIDASIVATQIMLAVHDCGLGTTWVGCFDPAVLRREFALPDSIRPVAVFPIGYPAEDAAPSQKHGERKAISETTVRETF